MFICSFDAYSEKLNVNSHENEIEDIQFIVCVQTFDWKLVVKLFIKVIKSTLLYTYLFFLFLVIFQGFSMQVMSSRAPQA